MRLLKHKGIRPQVPVFTYTTIQPLPLLNEGWKFLCWLYLFFKTSQGEIELCHPRLHVDLPVVLMENV